MILVLAAIPGTFHGCASSSGPAGTGSGDQPPEARLDLCDPELDGTPYYVDRDADGFGDPFDVRLACDPPRGYVADNSDCDDGDPDIHPGASEVCNWLDEDCDTAVDEGVLNTWYLGEDADGYGRDDSTTEACDDIPPPGYAVPGSDCNDANPEVNPGATEICNSRIDDDCDGGADGDDPDVAGRSIYYEDEDDDGHGVDGDSVLNCEPKLPYVAPVGGDCNDACPTCLPGAEEICGGQEDNDCDGSIDGEDMACQWVLTEASVNRGGGLRQAASYTVYDAFYEG